MKDLTPTIIQTPHSEESSEPEDTNSSSSPIFQFSPEFHRVPSPIFNPEFTFISSPKKDESKISKVKSPIVSLGLATVHSTSHPAENPILVNPIPLEKPKSPKMEFIPPPMTTSTNSQLSTVSARAKFFEMEIQQQQQPVTKPVKQFSFLSQHEVDRMKQEEDKKIASMETIEYMRPSELEQVIEEEEEFYVDTQSDEESEEVEENLIEDEDGGSSQNVHIRRSSPINSDVNVNVSVNVKAPNRSLLQPARSTSSMSSSSSTGSIRTAKAEKRFKEKMSKEHGVRFAEGTSGNDLSPSEQRAIQAEKRAAWRQARLKSLEQDALQAQMVLNRMNEIMDSPSQSIGANKISPSNFLPSHQLVDNSKESEPDEENNTEKSIPTSSKYRGRIPVTIKRNRSKSEGSGLANVDFPTLYIRRKSAGPKTVIGEREIIVGEKVSRKTEEWYNEETGTFEIRTIEIIEKTIEHEVETTEQKIISIELQGPNKGSSQSQESESDLAETVPVSGADSTPINLHNSSKRRRKKNSKKK